MELPQQLIENLGFLFANPGELAKAIGDVSKEDADEIERLYSIGLPPVISTDALAVMFGYNPGFIHSMRVSKKAHYRYFTIPKGAGQREIVAPKVAIKGIQKWLSFHFQKKYEAPDQVFGFVSGRSHIDAAAEHLGANWVCSVDIENFFPSVRNGKLFETFMALGYKTESSIKLLMQITGVAESLVQGAPSSPVLSNIALRKLDASLQEFAEESGSAFTRYADDIVFSGKGDPPEGILEKLTNIVELDGWTVAERKSSLDVLPNRLKVHGLLVHGESLRLTKGYRNRIRAYKHLISNNKVKENDIAKIAGHISYARHVDDRSV